MTARVPVAIGRPAAAEPAPSAVRVSPDYREVRAARSIEEIAAIARGIVEDPTFPTALAWTSTGRKAAAFFPVYTPQEIAHALGMLPVTIHGGGERVEIAHADAALGSFLCSISKSTLELAITRHLDWASALVFPYICDVSRNLEGIIGRARRESRSFMLHLPQNFESAATVEFLRVEYGRLARVLEDAAGARLDLGRLEASIRLYDRHRALTRELADLRREEPWRMSLVEHYLVDRLGGLVPKDVHVDVLERAIAAARDRSRRRRDAIRVVVVGPFCEQPPLDLVQLLEDVGCYVVGDEFHPLPRWHGPVALDSGDALRDLAAAYVHADVDIGVRRTPATKEAAILDRVRRADARAVIFLTAKFCEPAGEDLVLYRRALDRRGIPSLALEFEERSASYEQSRLALETFVESMMFE